MHGIEHCEQKRGTIRHLAPQKLSFSSFRINAAWLAACCFLPGTGRS
jgi:hypothetical protein